MQITTRMESAAWRIMSCRAWGLPSPEAPAQATVSASGVVKRKPKAVFEALVICPFKSTSWPFPKRASTSKIEVIE
ncbi:MAG: hypothetical protein WCF99_00030 [Chloroflexales bacterium]